MIHPLTTNLDRAPDGLKDCPYISPVIQLYVFPE